MVIAIPLATQTEYTELKYALRSIEKFLPKMEVVIVGDTIPWWLHNVTQILMADIPQRKQLTIRKKIMAALNYSDTILFTNDDVFFLDHADPKNYPYYTKGDLITESEPGVKPLRETLSRIGKPLNHYDHHYPLVYEKSKFCELDIFPAECIIKSMYGNYHEIQAIQIQDCKIASKMRPEVLRSLINYLPCLSTGPQGLPSVLPILEELFPDKSNFEL